MGVWVLELEKEQHLQMLVKNKEPITIKSKNNYAKKSPSSQTKEKH
jgi:hypothetical protein